MKLWISLCLFLLLGATAFAVRENSLESRLRRIIRLSNTDAGVAVVSGSRNWAVGNRKRPLLSVFKFFIAVQTLRQMEQTETALNAKLTVKENMTDANMYSPMLKKHPRRPQDRHTHAAELGKEKDQTAGDQAAQAKTNAPPAHQAVQKHAHH